MNTYKLKTVSVEMLAMALMHSPQGFSAESALPKNLNRSQRLTSWCRQMSTIKLLIPQ